MVKILHLFPNLMNLYGDYANITILKKHLEDQGLKVEVDRKDIEDNIYFEKYDFIYMGPGTNSNLFVALNEIKKYQNVFEACVKKGKTILFTGNAMELLGKTIDDKPALGIFDFKTEHTENIFTGDVIVKNPDLGFVVGFINKQSITVDGKKDRLFDYVYMDDGLNDNMYEGCNKGRVFGTHIIGPVLVKNPDFLQLIVRCLVPEKFKFKKVKYDLELASYIVDLNSLKDRIK